MKKHLQRETLMIGFLRHDIVSQSPSETWRMRDLTKPDCAQIVTSLPFLWGTCCSELSHSIRSRGFNHAKNSHWRSTIVRSCVTSPIAVMYFKISLQGSACVIMSAMLHLRGILSHVTSPFATFSCSQRALVSTCFSPPDIFLLMWCLHRCLGVNLNVLSEVLAEVLRDVHHASATILCMEWSSSFSRGAASS